MSELSRGFVSDSRFGSGQVIKRTNRSVTKKWRQLDQKLRTESTLKPQTFVVPGTCEACGQECCVCADCERLFGAKCPKHGKASPTSGDSTVVLRESEGAC